MCPPASGLPVVTDKSTSTEPTVIPSCVPADSVSQAAYAFAASHLHPLILAHSIRVYLYAHSLAAHEPPSPSVWTDDTRLHLLFTACILHDIGTTPAHDGPQRFEVEGADAAASFLRDQGVTNSSDIHNVWTAIAVHTSPGIAERIAPLAKLVRLAVMVDFKGDGAAALVTGEEVTKVEGEFPRGEIEKVLGDTVAEQGMAQPRKAPKASWPGVLVRAARENPGWEGVNKGF